jgi:MarR family transcriptional regulator, temperature-dependent positive regulator of motility
VGASSRSARPDISDDVLDDDTRYRLFRLLTEHPQLSQRELAGELGLSLGKTNYCLRALIERGWIKVQNFRNSDNKLAYAYVLTPSGVGAKFRATAEFLRRKQSEFARLEAEIAELRREVEAQSDAGVAEH